VTKALRLAVALLAVVAAAPARAVVTGYTSEAEFDAAIAGLVQTAGTDFDAIAANTVIPNNTTIGGIRFTFSIGNGLPLVIVDEFPTTSGTHALGVDVDRVFLSGDAFTIHFPPSTAVGLHLIGEDMQPGDAALDTATADVLLGEPEGTLADGSKVFFLGLVESDPDLAFTSATVSSFLASGVGDYVWNADDVRAAPEPGASAAALAAVLGLGRMRAARRIAVSDASAPASRGSGSGSTSERSSA